MADKYQRDIYVFLSLYRFFAYGLAVILFAAQSAVFFGHSSYRAYVDPLLIVLATSVLVELWQRSFPEVT